MSPSNAADFAKRSSFNLSAYAMPVLAVVLGAGIICIDVSHSMRASAPEFGQLQRRGLGP